MNQTDELVVKQSFIYFRSLKTRHGKTNPEKKQTQQEKQHENTKLHKLILKINTYLNKLVIETFHIFDFSKNIILKLKH